MKIAAFETQAVNLTRAEEPIHGTPGENVANFVTLTLRTSDGLDGIGYAGFIPTATLAACKACLDGLAEAAVGMDALDHEAVQSKLLRLGGFGSPGGLVTRAVAAIDIALWDIKGKACSQPVYKLLGGHRKRIPAYASGRLWRNESLDTLAETGGKLVEQGFRAMKLRMGAERSHLAEIERLRVLREAVGPDVDIMMDVNQGWDVNRAIRIGRKLEKYDLYWIEDPVHFEDYNGMARIAAALDTPLAAGEYHYGIAPFAHMLRCGSIDIAMVDLLRAGGITPWMKIAHMAEAFNIPVVSHLAPEILSHAVAAVPNGLIVEHMPWSLPLFRQEPTLIEGEIVLSDAAGFGLEFDEGVISKYAA